MSDFKIEQNIPAPTTYAEYTGYPFLDMAVGDSFFAEKFTARAAARIYGKRHGIKFATHKENKGYRVWRTE